MKKYFLYILITVLAVKANAQDGFKPSVKGTQYKILANNTGDKIKIGDVITFHVTQKTDKDSLLSSTYQTGRPAQAQVQAQGDLMDIFPLLALNDSVLVKVPTDTIFKAQEDHRPPFLPKGSNLLILIKIIKVQSLTEAMADRDKAMAAAKEEAAKIEAQEAVIADKYVADHKLAVTTTASGLKYKITKMGTKPKPAVGDTVVVNYVGHTLAGKVFDSSIEAVAKAGGLQQPGRVYEPLTFVIGSQGIIAGWQEGLQLINEGGKAMLIIPSKLAYGPDPSGPDLPGFSTLVFDVELVKVNRVKTSAVSSKPVASTAKKPVAKKAVAKKPVATKKKQ
ncbi:FKBP-type peptidyl-prolyl cis-trans isomerase [Mucilaginibacter sp. UYCu711]|uniref:FKBP-type peptidyl-prolyl cis-trans isomerase n=1 Tax=Mucilaginibacter sp. UYCu711 TaxID=3156339 RepID=UPI003D1D4F4B